MTKKAPGVVLSLVTPVFNEAGGPIPCFIERLAPVLVKVRAMLPPPGRIEIIFVDDGSSDGTLAELKALQASNPEVKFVSLSRNFGKDIALAAGLRYATGEAVIPMDVDLQDPPEVIPEMIERWQAGFDVVAARRADRSSDSWAKRSTARAFYRVFNRMAEQPILPDAGDFRLLSRRVVNVLNEFPERARFMKGLFSWVGFPACHVDYVRESRTQGTSKWRYWRLWNFAIDGITSSTTAPLRVWSYIGALVAVLALGFAAYLVVRTMILGIDVPGYASIMVAVLGLGGLNLLSLGIMGEYLGRTYTETKGRPLFIVKETAGL